MPFRRIERNAEAGAVEALEGGRLGDRQQAVPERRQTAPDQRRRHAALGVGAAGYEHEGARLAGGLGAVMSVAAGSARRE